MSEEKIEINLVKAVHGFDASSGAVIERITLRRPTGREILECGFPFTVTRAPRSGETTERIDAKPAIAMIAKIADPPLLTSSVEAMDAVDLYECIQVLTYFFHYGPPKKSSTDMSRQGAGAATAPSSSD